MDPLSDVLGLLRPASFGFRGLDAAGAWAFAFSPSPGIKAYAIESGQCWISLEGGQDRRRLGAGDFVLLPGRTAFRLYSDPEVEPLDAYDFFPSFPAGATGTINGGGECFGIGGFFHFEGRHAEVLLGILPPVVHIRADTSRAALGWLIGRMMAELREPQLGGALVAGHLAQTLLVEALRLHLADHRAGAGWLSALGDPRMRAALAAMHGDPARRWSLAELARVAGMSRSSFAARFKATVGEPALEYLTRWRMMLAADRLAKGGGATLAAVAPAVGYESESALGVAFKRVLGRSPRQFAAAAAGRPSGPPTIAGADETTPAASNRSAGPRAGRALQQTIATGPAGHPGSGSCDILPTPPAHTNMMKPAEAATGFLKQLAAVK